MSVSQVTESANLDDLQCESGSRRYALESQLKQNQLLTKTACSPDPNLAHLAKPLL